MDQTVPLDEDDVIKLTRLSFAWDCTPHQAFKRALCEAMHREENREWMDESYRKAFGHLPGEGE